MNKRSISLISLAFLATLGASACGSDPTPAAPAAAPAVPVAVVPTTAPAPTTTVLAATTVPAVSTAPAGQSIAVKAGSSSFGQILVDASGNTLYAFTNDTNAQSTCTGTCAEAWPPVIVDPSWTVAPGLDAGVFSTIIRDDGSEQLAAGRFPLYRFSGDARPGDTNGQGSGSVWFVVDTQARAVPVSAADATPSAEAGAPATTAAAAPTTTAPAPTTTAAAAAPAAVTVVDNVLGQILAGPDGRSVYGFLKDVDGTPTCVGGCAGAWPPVIVDASLDLSTLPNSQLFSIVDRPDGTKQLKAGKWPLYYFSGDAAPGETNGQGSGTNWFVVGADAKLIK